MRILDRYIFKSTLFIFLGCLATFLFLYVIIDIFSHLDEILKHRVALNILAQYYLSFLPIIFVQVSPIACLLATLYTFGRLNRNNEIIAMRASGLSNFQITKTLIIFGVIISAFVFWLNDKFLPSSLSTTDKIKGQMEDDAKKLKEKNFGEIENLTMYGLKNRLFFVNKFSAQANTLEGITILENDEHQNVIQKITADKAVFEEGKWRFYKTITFDFDEHGQIKGEPKYSEEEIAAISETPADFLSQRQRPDLMTIAQIYNYIWKLSKSGAATVIRNLKVDLYHRLTMPLTSVIIIILGIPFALKMKKRATGMSSLGLAIMMGFLYYVLNAVSIALGKSGLLIPIIAASISHILALICGLYLIKHLP